MVCLNCGAPKTIRAHLIPEAFVMEVKGDRGEQHLIVHHGADGKHVNVTGLYDPSILCGACDGRLGGFEDYAFKTLKRQRAVNAIPEQLVEVDPIDGDTMVRFAAGIVWKYAVTKPEFGRIEIGPYAEQLRAVALQGNDIPPSIDLAMIRAVELDGDVYHYRAPVPGRYPVTNMVRFSLGGFIFFLKIDKRPNTGPLPPECWMRGRTKALYVHSSISRFEEGRMHFELATSPTVSKFFRNMRERQSGTAK